MTSAFFATDLHGSTLCFKKFVNARQFYGADILILGGDLTGKQLIPIVESPRSSWTYRLGGVTERIRDRDLPRHEARIANMGYYTIRVDDARFEEIFNGSEERYEETLLECARKRLQDWIEYAEEKLEDADAAILVAPGNDDDPSIDAVFESSKVIQNVEGRCIDLPSLDGLTLISTGMSNPTPWDTPREVSEEELYSVLSDLTEDADGDRSILNIHVPPQGTPLDVCPQLDDDLSVVTEFGHPLMTHAGSRSVRRIIEEFQPIVSIHGHIHESTAAISIGRTLSVNPGSEYSEGVLKGVLLTFDGGAVTHRLTVG